jgi:hypothetical protein
VTSPVIVTDTADEHRRLPEGLKVPGEVVGRTARYLPAIGESVKQDLPEDTDRMHGSGFSNRERIAPDGREIDYTKSLNSLSSDSIGGKRIVLVVTIGFFGF